MKIQQKKFDYFKEEKFTKKKIQPLHTHLYVVYALNFIIIIKIGFLYIFDFIWTKKNQLIF